MPSKKNEIVALAAAAAKAITSSTERYMNFLTTAASNFKYSFRDQLLIYAQKPDAIACAEIGFWNSRGRWVNIGTKGIALLVDGPRGDYKLRYVFDLSDTNSRTGATVPIWHMEERYEEAVIEALINSFGEVEDIQGLPSALEGVVNNVVDDNLTDYLEQLMEVKGGSMLEDLDMDSLRVWLQDTLDASVLYMVLTRCGIDTKLYSAPDHFWHIRDFDTVDTISVLGAATSDISETILREVATTVFSLRREEQKRNRTFANRGRGNYDRPRGTNTIRSDGHGSDLQNPGRLSASQSDGTGGSQSREVWDVATQLPSHPQERDIHRDDVVRETERPSGGDRQAGHRDGGPADSTDGGGAGRDREPESDGSNEVGGLDEQHQGGSGGTGTAGPGVRISGALPTQEEQQQAIQEAEDEKSSAFSISQADIDAVLLSGSGFVDGKFRIYEHFLTVWNPDENVKFLKNEYGTGGRYPAVSGTTLDEAHDHKGIKISVGSISNPDVSITLNWKKAAKRIAQLVEAERYLSPAEMEQYPEYRNQRSARTARGKISEEFRSIIQDYNDYLTQLGETGKCLDVYPLSLCWQAFRAGQKKMFQTKEGEYILPLMRQVMQTIIGENTHLTERCVDMLTELTGPLATQLEPTFAELNPPPR